MKQSRRSFLGLAVGSAAGLAAGGYYLLSRDEIPDDDPLAALTGIETGSDEFEAIGRAYRERHAAEADRDSLLRALGFTGGVRQASTPEELLAIVHAGILRDVANDDLLRMEGWLLSRTECRLFALGSLDAS